MSASVVIEPRFNGFPRMAHGGYVSGVVAGLVGGPASITLRAPPPLGRPLSIRRAEGPVVSLLDGDRVIVKGVRGGVDSRVPSPPSFEQAQEAAGRFPRDQSPSPTCLCCGHLRRNGEGFRILPGAIPGREIVAAPWIPHPAFGDGDGVVRSEFVWAALDCPGAWGLRLRFQDGSRRLTVRMTAQLFGPVPVGERHVAIGWPIERRRRLLECGSALFGPSGDLLAASRGIWMQTSGAWSHNSGR